MAMYTLLEKTTLSASQVNSYFGCYHSFLQPAPFDLTVGEHYQVIWDGEVYLCPAQDAGIILSGAVFIGNAAAFGLSGNNEPFIIGIEPTAEGICHFICLTDTQPTVHQVAVYRLAEDAPAYLISGETLTAIATAIRAKNGMAGPITPLQMADNILAISGNSGNSDVVYVTFMTYDGKTELYKRAVVPGNDCMEIVSGGLIDAPVRESTAQQNYTFAGWSTVVNGGLDANALKNVTADRTVYANYIASTRCYSIRYYDGEALLHTQSVPYGGTPAAYTPEKEGFRFIGWDKEIATVTADASYYAQWLDMNAFLGFGSCGDHAEWTLTGEGVLTISGTGAMSGYDSKQQPWYAHNAVIASIVVEEGITEVGRNCFGGAAATSVSLPSTLQSLGMSCFAASAITSLVIPNNVTSIQLNAFANCTSLQSVTLSNTLTAIGAIFAGCSALASITIPASVKEIAKYAFNNCSSLKSAVFEVTGGWWYTTNASATSGTAISASLVGDPSNAALHLRSYYADRIWRRS